MDTQVFNAKRKSVETPSGRISYVEHGAGPVALFVHGVLLNGYLWRHQLAELSDLRRCIAVDLLAHGHTDAKPGQGVSSLENAAMLAQFLDALGIDRVDLVGNDSGGGIALIFAAEHPEPALGTVLLVCDEAGRVCALDFDEYESRMQRLPSRLFGEGEYALHSGPAARMVTTALESYFAGRLGAVDDLEVRMGGTPFMRRVWRRLGEIPAETTTSYGALAALLGQPTASRAVGLANGANPIAIIVPCHRVIGADGSLTGYGGGIERKRWLLAHERAFARVAHETLDGAIASGASRRE